MSETMQVRFEGAVVDREVAHITQAIQPDGSVIVYPEPLLAPGEVVFRPEGDHLPIIVVRTIPA